MKKIILPMLLLLVISGCKNSEKVAIESESSIEKVTVENSIPNIEGSSAEERSELSVSDKVKRNELVFEPHQYEYDVVTGATVTTFGSNPSSKFANQDEKLKAMFWSNQPPLGLMEGYYYQNEGDFDGGNHGIVEIVTDPDTLDILSVEFNEYTRNGYYEERYSGINKRLSDYAFFQADHTRTDETLATVVNGITYVEKQMRDENRVTGNFKTVNGSSTSARNGLMPIAAAMGDWIKEPYNRYYYGYAKELDSGLIGRLQIVTTDGVISNAIYDEYFADSKEKMTDEELKPYYRQSKYHSQDYNQKNNNDFINFSNDLVEEIKVNNSLTISNEKLKQHPSFPVYEQLAEQISIAK